MLKLLAASSSDQSSPRNNADRRRVSSDASTIHDKTHLGCLLTAEARPSTSRPRLTQCYVSPRPASLAPWRRPETAGGSHYEIESLCPVDADMQDSKSHPPASRVMSGKD